MSEERFDRIDRELAELRTDVSALKTDVSALKTDVSALKTDVSALKTDVSALKTDVSGLKNDVSGLKSGATDLATTMRQIHKELSSQMHILHEDLKADLKAMRVVEPELERRWKADDAQVREDIGRRLDPLESIVRKHFGT